MFQPALKGNVTLKITLFGPSGSGKTLSALKIASGLGGRIAMIDTENQGGELYADFFSFDVFNCRPPYSPERCAQAVRAAEQAAYDVLILDSLSQAWSGPGGVLEQVDAARRAKNESNPWALPARSNNRLIQCLLQCRCHVLATIRAKTERLASYTSSGPEAEAHPLRRGLAPEQRQGIEYEFMSVFSLCPGSPYALRIKDRTGIFSSLEILSSESGRRLAHWLQPAKRAA